MIPRRSGATLNLGTKGFMYNPTVGAPNLLNKADFVLMNGKITDRRTIQGSNVQPVPLENERFLQIVHSGLPAAAMEQQWQQHLAPPTSSAITAKQSVRSARYRDRLLTLIQSLLKQDPQLKELCLAWKQLLKELTVIDPAIREQISRLLVKSKIDGSTQLDTGGAPSTPAGPGIPFRADPDLSAIAAVPLPGSPVPPGSPKTPLRRTASDPALADLANWDTNTLAVNQTLPAGVGVSAEPATPTGTALGQQLLGGPALSPGDYVPPTDPVALTAAPALVAAAHTSLAELRAKKAAEDAASPLSTLLSPLSSLLSPKAETGEGVKRHRIK